MFVLTWATSVAVTYNATNMQLPGGQSITPAVGDVWIVMALGAGKFKVLVIYPGSILLTGISVPKRQTVLYGPSSGGLPSFLPATSGTRTISTTGISASAPLVFTTGRGFGPAGAVDDVFVLTANMTWTSVTASSTVYIGADGTTGTPVPIFTATAPIYQYGGTISTTSGQYTYDINAAQMYLGNGSVANPVKACFFGEVVTSGSAITSATEYAYQGRYHYLDTNNLPGAGAQIVQNHNIGVNVGLQAAFGIQCVTADNGYNPGDFLTITAGPTNTGPTPPLGPVLQRNTVTLRMGNIAAGIYINQATTGAAASPAVADWRYVIDVWRIW